MFKWRNPLAVKFTPAVVTKAVRADMRACIEVLDDVLPAERDIVFGAALGCVMDGGNHNLLTERMQAATGMSFRRAVQAGGWLVHRANALIERDRQIAGGIIEAKWSYSGSPCDGTAAQDAEHSAANGKTYRVKRGMLLDGVWTLPGMEAGCMCFSGPIVPGWIGEL